jgi:hypothetical protein
VVYQAQKYSQFHDPKYSNFEKLLQNKWSGLQVTPERLTTIRFGFQHSREVPSQLKYHPPSTATVSEISGIVIDDRYVDYTPRVFKIMTEQNQQMWVKTLFWSYQSCVTNGDLVKVRGIINKNVVYLTDYDHGIYSQAQADKL